MIVGVERCSVRSQVIDLNLAARASFPANDDVRLAIEFVGGVSRGTKREGAWPGERAAIEPGHIIMRLIVKQGESPGNDDSPIGLYGDGGNSAIGSASKVNRRICLTIRIQPGEPAASHAIERGEVATDQDLAIELKRQRVNRLISPESILEEIGVERTVSLQTRQIVA